MSLELTSQFNKLIVPQSKPVYRLDSNGSSTTNDSNENKNSKLTNKSITITMPNPFGKCKVCYDIASGIHYGIATCEGCKVFRFYNLKKLNNF